MAAGRESLALVVEGLPRGRAHDLSTSSLFCSLQAEAPELASRTCNHIGTFVAQTQNKTLSTHSSKRLLAQLPSWVQ